MYFCVIQAKHTFPPQDTLRPWPENGKERYWNLRYIWDIQILVFPHSTSPIIHHFFIITNLSFKIPHRIWDMEILLIYVSKDMALPASIKCPMTDRHEARKVQHGSYVTILRISSQLKQKWEKQFKRIPYPNPMQTIEIVIWYFA